MEPQGAAGASGGGLTWQTITANQDIFNGNGYNCNAVGTLSLNLPANPVAGDRTAVRSLGGSSILLNRNGSTINGSARDRLLYHSAHSLKPFELIYADSTWGWLFEEDPIYKDLVAYWDLENSLIDKIAGLTLVANNSNFSYVTDGINGSAVRSPSGVNATQFSLPAQAAWSSSTDWTISTWIRFTNALAITNNLIRLRSGTTIVAGLRTSASVLQVAYGASPTLSSSGSVSEVNNWMHIAVSRRSSQDQLVVFINGVQTNLRENIALAQGLTNIIFEIGATYIDSSLMRLVYGKFGDHFLFVRGDFIEEFQFFPLFLPPCLIDLYTPSDTIPWAEDWTTEVFHFLKVISNTELTAKEFEFQFRCNLESPRLELPDLLSFPDFPSEISLVVKANTDCWISWLENDLYPEKSGKIADDYEQEISIFSKRVKYLKAGKTDKIYRLKTEKWLINSLVISETNNCLLTAVKGQALVLYEGLENTLEEI